MVETDVNKSGIGCCLFCWCFKWKKKKKEKSEEAPQVSEIREEIIPYSGDLPELFAGQYISVFGSVQRLCNRFSVNLTCGPEPDADIALHFNPRMEQRYIVRNCRINGHWGTEETTSLAKFDLYFGQPFSIQVFVTETEFLVTVNGNHWCAFAYRIPLTALKRLEVRGRVDVTDIKYKMLKSYPEIQLEYPTITVDTMSEGDTCTVPYTAFLPKSFGLGWEVVIFGRSKMLPQHFYVNLQDGVQLWPHPNIPLHINPRFCTTDGVNVLIRNAWLDGAWGSEERGTGFPFLAGTDFHLRIQWEDGFFSVWEGSQMIGRFKFRVDISHINCIHISGDLDIHSVTVREIKDKRTSLTDLY